MKILYVAPASPEPRNFGGSLRVAALVAALERCGEVELLVVADEPGDKARRHLAARGATLWATARESGLQRGLRIASAALARRSIPAQRFAGGRYAERLRDFVAASRPDVVVLGDTFLGEAAPLLRDLGCRLVIDTHNVESALAREIAAVAKDAFTRAAFGLLASNTALLERRVLPLADAVWAASADDAAELQREFALARVEAMPNVLAESPPLGEPEERASLLLSGFFAYAPNEDAALELLEVSRELVARGREHRLYLVGRAPSSRMMAAARGMPQVTITGEVESVEPWLRRSSIFAAPLRAGSGTKFKLLQAMLAGRPVVTTPNGARGLDLEHGVQALVVERREFPATLDALLDDDERCAELCRAARRHVLERFSQRALDEAMRRSIEALGGAGR